MLTPQFSRTKIGTAAQSKMGRAWAAHSIGVRPQCRLAPAFSKFSLLFLPHSPGRGARPPQCWCAPTVSAGLPASSALLLSSLTRPRRGPRQHTLPHSLQCRFAPSSGLLLLPLRTGLRVWAVHSVGVMPSQVCFLLLCSPEWGAGPPKRSATISSRSPSSALLTSTSTSTPL